MPNITISTTLTIEEYKQFKAIGLPWNRLIRMGVNSLKNNNSQQVNERLITLEKAYSEVRNKYYELKRKQLETENKQ